VAVTAQNAAAALDARDDDGERILWGPGSSSAKGSGATGRVCSMSLQPYRPGAGRPHVQPLTPTLMAMTAKGLWGAWHACVGVQNECWFMMMMMDFTVA
jgi:hypothetical protein